MKTFRRVRAVLMLPLVLSAAACETDVLEPNDEEITISLDDTDFEATDWTAATHSNDADPDFEEVFDDQSVKRIDIVVDEDRWTAMLQDMTNRYGAFGGGGGGLIDSDENPIFVPAEVLYEGREWYRVGVRFKGNSSLQSSWRNGILKLSFKLDFDEFEDDYPQIDNQRFFGFKKLSLKNNYDDPSMLREKVASEVFMDAGLAGSHTAFYAVYVDNGDGPIYFGLYTMVEEIDDTVLDTQFSDDDGNLYKPDGDGASFAEGSFSEEVFVKKTNEDEADWSDVQSLFAALHADTRTTDAATWRTGLEAVFDVDAFLNYLAVNTVVQNWDTYGRMTHNYYLYSDPDTDRMVWIPWDNNESLQEGKMGGALSLDFSDLTPNAWPLIEYLYADSEYRTQYDSHLDAVINGPFETSSIQGRYGEYAALVEPFAAAEIDGYTFLRASGEFQTAIAQLETHASSRAAAVRNYLGN